MGMGCWAMDDHGVEENAGAMKFGPLTPSQITEVDRILGR